MRHTAILTAMFLLCVAAVAHAEIEFNGYAENQLRLRSAVVEDEIGNKETPWDFTMADTLFDARISGTGFDERARMLIDADVRVVGLDRDEQTELRLREAWAGFYDKGISFEFGKKSYIWGFADEMNPTDLLCPEDLRWFFTYDKPERKLGVYSTSLAYSYDNFKLQAVWIPLFTPTVLPDSNEAWTPWKLQLFYDFRDLFADFVDYDAERLPDPSFANSAGALKFSGVLGPVDFELIAFDGWDPLPTYDITVDPDPAVIISGGKPLKLRQEYQRFNAYGGSLTGALGPITYRAEGAYYTDRYFMNDIDEAWLDPGNILATYQILITRGDEPWRTQKSSFSVTGGFDYRYSSWFYGNLQYFHIQILDYEDILLDEEIENGLTAKFQFLFLEDMLQFNLSGAYNVSQQDWTVNPNVSYLLTDSLKIEGGWQGYGGEHETNFGEFDENDYVYTKVRFTF
jgi:hypothetical protein